MDAAFELSGSDVALQEMETAGWWLGQDEHAVRVAGERWAHHDSHRAVTAIPLANIVSITCPKCT